MQRDKTLSEKEGICAIFRAQTTTAANPYTLQRRLKELQVFALIAKKLVSSCTLYACQALHVKEIPDVLLELVLLALKMHAEVLRDADLLKPIPSPLLLPATQATSGLKK